MKTLGVLVTLCLAVCAGCASPPPITTPTVDLSVLEAAQAELGARIEALEHRNQILAARVHTLESAECPPGFDRVAHGGGSLALCVERADPDTSGPKIEAIVGRSASPYKFRPMLWTPKAILLELKSLPQHDPQ